jgi:hypothetical protein
VSRQCQCEFIAHDTVTVVTNAHQLLAARDNVDLHGLGARVEAVFDQLLDDRSGALDDLAGRDLVDQVIGELLDGHPGDYAGAVKSRTGRFDQPPEKIGILSVWLIRILSLDNLLARRMSALLTL